MRCSAHHHSWSGGAIMTREISLQDLDLTGLCGYLEIGIIGSDVIFLQPSAPDERGRYSFSLENGYMQAAISRARVVIAEVNDQLPWTYFDGALDPARIDYVVPVSE